MAGGSHFFTGGGSLSSFAGAPLFMPVFFNTDAGFVGIPNGPLVEGLAAGGLRFSSIAGGLAVFLRTESGLLGITTPPGPLLPAGSGAAARAGLSSAANLGSGGAAAFFNFLAAICSANEPPPPLEELEAAGGGAKINKISV